MSNKIIFNKPVKSLCAFIDILGYQKIVEDSYKYNKEIELLKSLKKIINEALQYVKTHDENPIQLIYKIFSDNILIVRPIANNDFSEFELHSMIQSIAHYQRSMILNGFFVRGGLTIGSIYLDENIIFGKALLDTYEYESKIANTPRIIIDENVKEEILKYIKREDYKEDTPQNRYILIDDDKKGFIDYLTITHFDWNKILKHKDEIEKKLNENRSDFQIFSKYLWLANYHNYFCDENKMNIDNYEKYKIGNNNLKINFKRYY